MKRPASTWWQPAHGASHGGCQTSSALRDGGQLGYALWFAAAALIARPRRRSASAS